MNLLLLTVALLLALPQIQASVKTTDSKDVLYAKLTDEKISQKEKDDIELAKINSCMNKKGDFDPTISKECAEIQQQQQGILDAIKFQYDKNKLVEFGDATPTPSPPSKKSKFLARRQKANGRSRAFLELQSTKNPLKKTDHWARGLVPYFFDATTLPAPTTFLFFFTQNKESGVMRAKCEAAMKAWQTATCIRFKEVASTTTDDRLKFNVVSERRCASTLGAGAAEMSLCQPGSGSWSNGCPTGTIVHEIGHALGVKHTMTRSDRDSWVSYDSTAPHSVHASNYDVASSTDYDFSDFHTKPNPTNNDKFDDFYHSTMMYGAGPIYTSPLTAWPKDEAARYQLAKDSGRYPKVAKWDKTDPAAVLAVTEEAKRRAGFYQRDAVVNEYDAGVVNAMYGCFSITIKYKDGSNKEHTATLRLNKDWQYQELLDYVQEALVELKALAKTDKIKLQKANTDIVAPNPLTNPVGTLVSAGDTVTAIKI